MGVNRISTGIEIEDGILVPPPAGRALKYPWDRINIGQSFLVPGRQKKLLVPKRLKPRKFTGALTKPDFASGGRLNARSIAHNCC
jgi:hypothetical protein